ncbi:hypothetical protein D8Y20_09745 [Mariprofundus sp. EBB-1]|uniref:hypothetical protein n=1 Tax=Mariprofundus sp. EBB-1 TaxID=2650971 RepID=UPI000EF1E7AC|nr:hypothetical protein [Mariprofundus sp. EBB-1]RLL51265.1 hypothetical protein D8Y20_09745 [Mariprofundus sp. EBB-1]
MSIYLRPVFTASLANTLLAGACIHLISAHGQGRRRTLQDLRHLLSGSLQTFHMNMRSYKFDYKDFIDDLILQSGSKPSTPQSLDSILKKIERKPQNSLLILHNFDELRCTESIHAGYSSLFFQALNSIQHRKNIALLCVSEHAFDHYLIQADGSEVVHSNLEAEFIHLPTITCRQIIAELRRRNVHLSENELQQLASSLRAQPAPYSALENIKN